MRRRLSAAEGSLNVGRASPSSTPALDEAARQAEAAALDRQIIGLISRGFAAPPDEATFNELALAVFAHQFRYNTVYAAYCARRDRTPQTVRHWLEIPAVPTRAFKGADLCAFPPAKARVTYLTSGTTLPGRRGRHLLESTALYDASLLPNFARHVLPDRSPGERLRFYALFPHPTVLPHSSLGHMIARCLAEFGDAGSAYALDAAGLHSAVLAEQLTDVERTGEPVALLGTATSFIQFLDWLATRNQRFRLPAGSRVMDTGGFKGEGRPVAPDELRALYSDYLGIPPSHAVNEYGMTELGSQFYDGCLADAVFGPPAGFPEATPTGRAKVVPPWVRTIAVDPQTLEPLPPGAEGLLRHVDLANRGSVLAVQTEDVGRLLPAEPCAFPRFELIGRAAGAEPRGCSIAVSEILAAAERQTDR